MRVQLNVVQGRGAPRTIAIDAANVEAARQQATGQGYSVLSVHAASFAWRPRMPSRASAGTLDVVIFIEQLRDLLVAGLSVVEALDALRRGARGASEAVIERLQRQLQEGKTFSDALAADSLVFPALLVALVRASEHTSDLPQTLGRFLEHERRVAEVRHRIVSTSIYPMLLVGVGGLVLLFLLFYVMPRFARVFEGMTGELPWSAKAMLAWSQTLHAHGTLWAGLMAAPVLAFAVAVGLPTARTAVLRRALDWAPLRERLNTYFLARWYRATGMLVLGGIPLPQSLQLTHGLLPLALQGNAAQVEQGVREGLAPSAAHVRAGMATPVAEQLLLAGERTGDLGAVLTRIAHFHEAEVSRNLERTMRALEPIVMVLIGLGVGVVVVLMYMPIFELASAIQ
jgi:general secretion pathway protein F